MNLIKTGIGIFLGVVVAIWITSKVIGGLYDREISDIDQEHDYQIAVVNYQKDSLASHSDSINNILDRIRAENDSLFKIDYLHRVEIDRLKGDLKTALNEMFDNLTEDAHYDMLQNMYPTFDSLVYPFSGEQIKDIHMDLVRSMYKDSIITEYELNEEILRSQVLNYAEMADILIIEKDNLEELIKDLQNQLIAKIEQDKLNEKEIARLEKIINKFRAGGIGVVGAAILLLIFL